MDCEKIDFSPGSQARTKIKNEFNLEKWKPFRSWFFESFSKKDRSYFQEEFYKFLEQKNVVLPFIPWFFSNYVEDFVNAIERDYILSDGSTTKAVHPPQVHFTLESNQKTFSFQAFSKLLENDALPITAKHVNKMMEQQNYANLFLKVLGEQIISLNDRIEKLFSLVKSQEKAKEKVDKGKDEVVITSSSIQPPPEVKDFKRKSITELEKFLEQKFQGLKINTLEEEFVDNISQKDYKQGVQDEINKIEKYQYADRPTTRLYYYRRPSPMDTLHEEQEYFISNSYSGKNIYEWNIDGFTERQIYNLVHRMLMFGTISKNSGNSDSTVAKMIIAGFTGQLKGWWDNYLSEENRLTILSTVKQENGQITENVVYTLVVTILEHFTGRMSNDHETARTLLQNLRCKSLTDFRWYKDTFLNRVMNLPEGGSSHWKSKFVDGLPHLFAERVRKNLRKDRMSIPYEDYTYGKLIAACIQEGLQVCNEIKLNRQIKSQNLTNRKELGQFCSQFGVDIPKTSKGYKEDREEKKLRKSFYHSKRRTYSKRRREYKDKRRAERLDKKAD